MTAAPAPPSTLRRIVCALAAIGLDLRPQINRARDFLLRPVRHEMADRLSALTASQVDLGRRIDALTREIRATADALSVARGDQTDNLDTLRHGQLSTAALVQLLQEATDECRMQLAAQEVALQHEVDRRTNIERERMSRIALLERLVSAGPAVDCTAVRAAGVRQGPAPVVSVILATYNRADFVGDAIRSVLAQHFVDWELIVVDDGSTDDSRTVIAAYLDDPRIRLVELPHLGVAEARNEGMRVARGELIAHLDSDNLWFPGFLSEATQSLRANPDVELVYGVLVSDAHQLNETCLLFVPFDRARLLQHNYIDTNTIVFRRSLYEALGGFDQSLDRLVDWDLVLRYTADAPALALPVLAARYRVCDAHRISDTVPSGPNWAAIKRKWHPAILPPRKPRVLYVVWHYPQLSETYLEGDIRCMRRWGAQVDVWRMIAPASPYPTPVPIHEGSLAEVVRQVKPDVIHIHWLSFADSQAAMLSELGVPVTIRMHGFDVNAERLSSILAKPWLHAIYAFPAQMRLQQVPDQRLKQVPVAFETALFRPRMQKNRRMVIRTGACIPSKDIAFFFRLAKLLPDYRFVFAGVTCNEFESYVGTLRELRESLDSPVELMFDVPRDAVAELVAQAGIYVHTIHPPDVEFGAPIGMPISIAEAMATGAHILVRDLPELVDYVGDAGVGYRDLDQAAEIIAATADWTEAQWHRAWTRSVDRAFMNHADEIVLRPIFEDWCALVRAEKDARVTQTV